MRSEAYVQFDATTLVASPTPGCFPQTQAVGMGEKVTHSFGCELAMCPFQRNWFSGIAKPTPLLLLLLL